MWFGFRLIENGHVSITSSVVHVNCILAVGQKERCNKSCDDLNCMINVITRETPKRGSHTISQHKRGSLSLRGGVTMLFLRRVCVPLAVNVKLDGF